jgi:hypothetical protein
MRSGLGCGGTVEVNDEVQSVSIPDSSALPIEATEGLGKPGEHYLLTIETDGNCREIVIVDDSSVDWEELGLRGTVATRWSQRPELTPVS